MAGAGDGLRRLAQRAERLNTDWPREAATLAERNVAYRLALATGGDGRLSRAPRIGTATTSVELGERRGTVVGGGSRGVWNLIGGTKPHKISGRGGRPLGTPFGPRQFVNHPGTRGSQPFKEGIAESLGPARALAEQMARELGGG